MNLMLFLERWVRGALSPGVIKGDGNTCSSGDFIV